MSLEASDCYELRQILKHSENEGVRVSRMAVCPLLIPSWIWSVDLRYKILEDEHYRFIDNVIANNLDLTSRQILTCEYPDLEATSVSTVKRAQSQIRWESKWTRHCAPISERIVEKGLEFAKTWSRRMSWTWRYLDRWVFRAFGES